MDVLWVCYELCACCGFVQMKTAIRKVQLADQPMRLKMLIGFLCSQILAYSKSPLKKCTERIFWQQTDIRTRKKCIYIPQKERMVWSRTDIHPPETMYITTKRIFGHGPAFTQPENNEFAHTRKNFLGHNRHSYLL